MKILSQITDPASGLHKIEIQIRYVRYIYIIDSYILSQFNSIWKKSNWKALNFIKKRCIEDRKFNPKGGENI